MAKKKIQIPKNNLVIIAKVQKLIAVSKYSSASVVLANNAGELSAKEFNYLNKEIKSNTPKPKKGGDFPTSCGRNRSRRGTQQGVHSR